MTSSESLTETSENNDKINAKFESKSSFPVSLELYYYNNLTIAYTFFCFKWMLKNIQLQFLLNLKMMVFFFFFFLSNDF